MHIERVVFDGKPYELGINIGVLNSISKETELTIVEVIASIAKDIEIDDLIIRSFHMFKACNPGISFADYKALVESADDFTTIRGLVDVYLSLINKVLMVTDDKKKN